MVLKNISLKTNPHIFSWRVLGNTVRKQQQARMSNLVRPIQNNVLRVLWRAKWLDFDAYVRGIVTFFEAIAKLRQRCINSGYDNTMVDEILAQASSLNRVLTPQVRNQSVEDDKHVIRWVVLSGTAYEKQISDFTGRINRYLDFHGIKLELVNSTGSSIGKLLFNNNVRSGGPHKCNSFCVVCTKGLLGDSIDIL